MVGNWGGKGAERLGLRGTVGKREFDALCENLHPTTGERLTARTNADRTTGYDFSFSAPKSLSLLYGLTEDKELLDAFRKSVDETMHDIEAEMKTRIRKGGKHAERITGSMIWAEFIHTTARPINSVPDPQLHAHCFCFNSTFDLEENRWKAGYFRDLKRDAPFWQAAFRARLANRLQDLVYEIDRSKKDDFEIRGFSKDVLKRFSRRTAKIEELAEARGITDPQKKAELGKASREKKNATLTWKQLQKEWRNRLTDAEQDAIERIQTDRGPPLARFPGERAAVDYAILHCFERDSVVSERQLQTEALQRGVGYVTLAGINKELSRRNLIIRDIDGRRLVTSPEVLAEERWLVSYARGGRGTSASLGGFDREFSREWLSDEQKRAVRHIWESPDKVIFIRGAAGTGKTTLIQEAVAGIEANGCHVVALAQSAAASRGVLREEAGLKDADTVARFLQDHETQEAARGGVILVDEASLLGARTLSEVFHKAESLHARLILVGDPKQHGPIERGTALRLLTEEAGLPVVEVTEIKRQRNAEYKRAVEDLSAGRTVDGWDRLDALGWIREFADGERERTIAQDYLAAVSEKKGNEFKTALVVSPTHVESDEITYAIRSAMRAAGRLGEERTFATWSPANLTEAERGDAGNYQDGDMLQLFQHIPGNKSGERLVVSEGQSLPLQYAKRFQVYRPTTLTLAVGDRIRITANGKTRNGVRINNGAMFTVQGFTPRGDIVIDQGQIIAREFGHVTHGYVATSYASQGKTVDKVLIGQSASSGLAASPEQFYVSASRARESVAIYVDDKQAVRDTIGSGRPSMSATELSRKPHGHKRHRRLLAFRRRQQQHIESTKRATPAQGPERMKEVGHER